MCGRCYGKTARQVRNARVSAEKKRAWNRSSRYNLSNDQVDTMISGQGGRCAICSDLLPVRYHIDHCHKTGRVRGILCYGCNLKLPMIEDETKLRAALRYLGLKTVQT